MSPRKPSKNPMQVVSLRISPTVLDRADKLLEAMRLDPEYQLLSIEDRSEVLRLAIAKGISAIEKELAK